MGGLNKRDHLIKIGQDLIWSKGYDICSIKDITDAAGLPKGSFYHYFKSKEKFALEAMEVFIEDHPEQIKNKSYTLDSLGDVIDRRINSIIKIQFARECYMSVMCHAFSDQEDSFRKSIIESINKSNDTMRFLITELKEKGVISAAIDIDELEEFIDFTWRGARLKARILKSDKPLKIFKKYLLNYLRLA